MLGGDCLIGKRFGRLIVLSKSEIKKENLISWMCRCDCGNEIIAGGSRLRGGRVKSCGCLQRDKARESIKEYNKSVDPDLTGMTFGRLTVIKKIGTQNQKNIWLCKCECGKYTKAATYYLTSGDTKSCGCLVSDTSRKLIKKLIKSGSEHPRYNPNITDKERIDNRYQLYGENMVIWRKKVYERDNYTCQLCGKYEGDHNAHHLNSWDKYPKERFSVNNGVTLCINCHKRFHSIYGYGNNTKGQFEEFRELSHSNNLKKKEGKNE